MTASQRGAGPGRRPHLDEEAALQQGGFSLVAGVDEAGRGAWAGPLVAGAVIVGQIDPDDLAGRWAGVRDSKLLSPEQRAAAFELIQASALAVGVGSVAPAEIDLLGLTAANELAMARAVRALPVQPQALLVDAFVLRSVLLPQRALIEGDARSLSIAAASIVAKVTRDRWMARYADEYPEYGFNQHVGYGVAIHQEALDRVGPCPIHRLSYAPLRTLMGRP
ncbi:MAG: ribonuclease HII [Chloroflexi bacterium]|nr:ribonuclease HII [Chloroflexota bacterium]